MGLGDFGHQALPPPTARQHIAAIKTMRSALAQREGTPDDIVVPAHQHVSALDLARGSNGALEVRLRFPPIAMGPPYHVASDLFILSIGIEYRVGILDCHWPQQEASGPKGVRQHTDPLRYRGARLALSPSKQPTPGDCPMAEMNPLRRCMIEDMKVRNLSPATQRCYVHAVAKFAQHFNRSPDRLGLAEIRAYQIHLTSIGGSWAGFNVAVCALRFFYGVTPGVLRWSIASLTRASDGKCR
jgi:hypothetical protein